MLRIILAVLLGMATTTTTTTNNPTTTGASTQSVGCPAEDPNCDGEISGPSGDLGIVPPKK